MASVLTLKRGLTTHPKYSWASPASLRRHRAAALLSSAGPAYEEASHHCCYLLLLSPHHYSHFLMSPQIDEARLVNSAAANDSEAAPVAAAHVPAALAAAAATVVAAVVAQHGGGYLKGQTDQNRKRYQTASPHRFEPYALGWVPCATTAGPSNPTIGPRCCIENASGCIYLLAACLSLPTLPFRSLQTLTNCSAPYLSAQLFFRSLACLVAYPSRCIYIRIYVSTHLQSACPHQSTCPLFP